MGLLVLVLEPRDTRDIDYWWLVSSNHDVGFLVYIPGSTLVLLRGLGFEGSREMEKDEFVVYVLRGRDSETKAPITDYGIVRVLKHQTRDQAGEWRLLKHLSDKKDCLECLSAKTAEIEVISTRMPESKALLLEAARTVVAYTLDNSVRGGPYCLRNVAKRDAEELGMLSHVAELGWLGCGYEELKELGM